METSIPHSGLSRRRGRSLSWIVVLMAIAPAVTFLSEGPEIPLSVRVLALCAWVLTLWPSWQYLRTSPDRRPPIPFFPLVAMAFGLYFALQVALGQDNQFYRMRLGATARLDPLADYATPVSLFFGGWLALLAARAFARRAWTPSRARRRLEYGLRADWGFVLAILGLVLYGIASLDVIPASVVGLATFVVSLGLAGISILVVLDARGQLTRSQRWAMVALIASVLIVRLGTGFIANVGWVLVVIVASRWIALGRLGAKAVVLIAACLVAGIAAKGLMAKYRAQVWYGSEGKTLVSRMQVLSAITRASAANEGLAKTVTGGASAIAARSAYMDVFADVVRQTPEVIPFWAGESYIALAGTVVPRILWPDKPSMVLGQAFGHRYHYLAPHDLRTSMNLPYVIEFYANFGVPGVLIGMFLVGLIFGLLEAVVNVPGQPTIQSIAGLVLLLPLLNVESDFGLNFGGLFLNALAIGIVLYLFRRLQTRAVSPASTPPELAAAALS